MGTDWSSLRIGVRFCVNDAARSTYTNIGAYGYALGLGVCQGTTTSWLDDTVTDWMGGGYIGSTAAPSGAFNTHTAGTPNYYTMVNGRPNALRKSGSSYTWGSETGVGWYITGSGSGGAYAGQYMSCVYVDITKGSPYSINIYYCNSIANAQTNITNAVFIANMETTGTPSNTSATGAKTIAYSGSGLFDSLSVYCTRSWPVTEIDAIAVTRLT